MLSLNTTLEAAEMDIGPEREGGKICDSFAPAISLTALSRQQNFQKKT
jgi:hypothetical protein